MTQQLPTEAGWYLDKGGTAWVVTDDGSLSELIEREYYPRDTWNPRAHAPFTRLVPLSVEDRTLIARVLDDWIRGRRDSETAGARALAARIAPDQNGHGA